MEYRENEDDQGRRRDGARGLSDRSRYSATSHLQDPMGSPTAPPPPGTGSRPLCRSLPFALRRRTNRGHQIQQARRRALRAQKVQLEGRSAGWREGGDTGSNRRQGFVGEGVASAQEGHVLLGGHRLDSRPLPRRALCLTYGGPDLDFGHPHRINLLPHLQRLLLPQNGTRLQSEATWGRFASGRLATVSPSTPRLRILSTPSCPCAAASSRRRFPSSPPGRLSSSPDMPPLSPSLRPY